MFLAKHSRQTTTSHIVESVERSAEYGLPILSRHHEHHAVTTNAGIVDEIGDVVIGVGFCPSLEGTVHLLLICHVEGHQFSCSSSSLYLSLDGFCSCLIALIIDDDGQTLSRQFEADSTSQSARSASY